MIKKVIIYLFCFVSHICAGEISVSISESLVNDYLKLIDSHEIPKGRKNDQAFWSIIDPYVKFEKGKASFYANVRYRKGKINIKKNINKNMYVEYNYDDNIINLMIENPIITMERKNQSLGKLDISSLYQQGLKFQGPRPKDETIKLKTVKGKIKIEMNIKKSLIYFEEKIVRVAIDLDYQ